MSYKYDTNFYGYWQYFDVIGIEGGIEEYDLVYVYKVSDNMAHGINEKGRKIYFHKTFITKKSFGRPSYKHHKTCELGESSTRFYKTLAKDEHHKNDCHECQMYKFKKIVERFKKGRNK